MHNLVTHQLDMLIDLVYACFMSLISSDFKCKNNNIATTSIGMLLYGVKNVVWNYETIPNFNGWAVEVWEWINNFIWYLIPILGLKLMMVNESQASVSSACYVTYTH